MNNSNFGIRSLSNEEVTLIGGADGGVSPCPCEIIPYVSFVYGPYVGAVVAMVLGCD